jgi:hypothetical protein
MIFKYDFLGSHGTGEKIPCKSYRYSVQIESTGTVVWQVSEIRFFYYRYTVQGTLSSTGLSCCVLIKHLLRADIRMLLFITGIFLLGPAISPALQPIPNKQQTTLQSKRRLDQIIISILISFADSVIRYRYEPDV